MFLLFFLVFVCISGKIPVEFYDSGFLGDRAFAEDDAEPVRIPAGTILWKFETWGEVYSSPVVVDGVVYFGSADTLFYAVDAVTGAEIWHVDTGGPINNFSTVADGVVYFSSENYVYAVNAKDGSLKWRFEIACTPVRIETPWESLVEDSSEMGELEPPGASSPAVSDGVVYFGMWNNLYGSGYICDKFLYAVNASDGTELWRFQTDGLFITSAPAVNNGIVYFGTDYGDLYAVRSRDGSVIWKSPEGEGFTTIPFYADGTLYVGWEGAVVYALDSLTGSEQWMYRTGLGVYLCAAFSLAPTSNPVVVDGRVYFGGSDGDFKDCLYALDARSGKEVWRFNTGGRSPFSSSPRIQDGIVYVGSDDHCLYAVDAETGEERWRFETEGPVESSPAVENGIVYFGSNDTYLYAVE